LTFALLEFLSCAAPGFSLSSASIDHLVGA
jgi:hypothetical protein